MEHISNPARTPRKVSVAGSLLDESILGNAPGSDGRGQMSHFLLGPAPSSASAQAPSTPPPLASSSRPAAPPTPPPLVSTPPSIASHHSPVLSAQNSLFTTPQPVFMPGFIILVERIRQELETQVIKLLSLNPSRREAIAQYLDRLAGHLPSSPATGGAMDASAGLRRWIDGPRTTSQNSALRTFFNEVALVTLGQAMVLKGWADRGLRQFRQQDIADLNWSLSNSLRSYIPHDREGWQITRPNLYSWFKPSPTLQAEIWTALESWRFGDEGPHLIAGLLRLARQAQSESPEFQSYDQKFFSSLWEKIPSFGISIEEDTSPLKRKRMVFSPTLRDGQMVRTGPTHLQWIGVESHPFQILMAELVQLWWGPSTPPLWALGSGLEVHSRDQLQLALGSPKPSIYSRIAEMEACDLALVLEERSIRLNARSPEAQRVREQADTLPYFKKLKGQSTSLGDMQACVALTKLRPGGLLWWAREEPLCAQDGTEVLGFLLDRAKLICEWDFSAVGHSLPVRMPLFPKYLYLFVRETDMQERLNHRPMRVSLHGQIRSYIELPLILGDALQSAHSPAPAHGQWQILAHASPSCQKEWAERWPDPAAHDTLRALEELRTASSPLASVATVRATPQGNPERDHAWTVPANYHGVWLHAEHRGEARRLIASSLPRQDEEVKGSGFLVLMPDEKWVAPLRCFLESSAVQNWLEHYAERKNDRWVLSEQLVRYIPVPKLLLQALGINPGNEGNEPASAPLPTEWERLAADLMYHPGAVRERLTGLADDELGNRIKATIFVRAAQAIEQIRGSQAKLLSIVTSDGKIRWKHILEILPKSECAPVTMHPMVRLSGMLPPHIAISRFDRVKSPSIGILLSTEAGFHLNMGCETPLLLDMIWDQIDGLKHPTWNELTQYLKLPRKLDLAEQTASDILLSHGEMAGRLQQLQELLASALQF